MTSAHCCNCPQMTALAGWAWCSPTQQRGAPPAMPTLRCAGQSALRSCGCTCLRLPSCPCLWRMNGRPMGGQGAPLSQAAAVPSSWPLTMHESHPPMQIAEITVLYGTTGAAPARCRCRLPAACCLLPAAMTCASHGLWAGLYQSKHPWGLQMSPRRSPTRSGSTQRRLWAPATHRGWQLMARVPLSTSATVSAPAVSRGAGFTCLASRVVVAWVGCSGHGATIPRASSVLPASCHGLIAALTLVLPCPPPLRRITDYWLLAVNETDTLPDKIELTARAGTGARLNCHKLVIADVCKSPSHRPCRAALRSFGGAACCCEH